MSRRDEVEALRAELAAVRAGIADEVAARVALILSAKEVAASADFTGCRTLDEIRARAVAHVYGFAEIQDACPDEITGMFRAMVATVVRDPVRLALATPGPKRH